MPVVHQMIPVVEPRDRPNGRQYQEICPKIVLLDLGKEPAMHSIMRDDEQSIIAVANNRNSDEDSPPGRMDHHDAERRYDARPTCGDVLHGVRRFKRAQLSDTSWR